MSDLHLGGAATNEKHIRRELEEARKNKERININGDVMDLIMPKDLKRYRPEVLKAALQGRDDLLDATVDYAVKFLEPYAPQIDVIGIGNHEQSVLTHHNLNLVKGQLIPRLNQQTGSKIQYGGWGGYIVYRIERYGVKGNVREFTIFYYHGAGRGSAEVTLGYIEFNRKRVFVHGADVIWLGHTHDRTAAKVVALKPTESAKVIPFEVLLVRSGGYDNYLDSGYAMVKGMAPKPHGGQQVWCRWVGHGCEKKEIGVDNL